jgi:hypothetical protein
MAICYVLFALKSRLHCKCSRRGHAWQRGAAGLVALVVCGFLAPTALASPPTVATAGSLPATDSSEIVGAATPAEDLRTASQPAPAEVPDPNLGTTATTGQTAGSTATATQQQPVNLVVIVRVNSPGNNGPITQNNVAAAPSAAANSAATTQGGGGGGGKAASTGQQATATATATQDAAGNYVVTVRIDSPGSNGAVTQTNGVVGASTGTNTSKTAQQVAAPKSAVQPQAHHAGAANSRRSAGRHRQRAALLRATTDVEPIATTPHQVAIRHAPAHRHPAPAREPRTSTQTHVREALSGIASGAARAFSPLVPNTSPVAAEAAGPADVSRAVLLTLLVLVAAAATFALFRRATLQRQTAASRPRR